MIEFTGTVLRIPDPADRDDLATMMRRVLGMDEATVVRITDAGGGRLRVWARTPLHALASRVVTGSCPGGDLVVGADQLADALAVASPRDGEGLVEPGMPLTSAWTGLLPPADDFTAVESIPAQVLLDLAEQGRRAARENAGPLGLPPSLLDQVALTVGTQTPHPAGVDMRSVFAVVNCGFIPERGGQAPPDEPVRVSVRGPWLRLAARYGTVHRRPDNLPLEVTG